MASVASRDDISTNNKLTYRWYSFFGPYSISKSSQPEAIIVGASLMVHNISTAASDVTMVKFFEQRLCLAHGGDGGKTLNIGAP